MDINNHYDAIVIGAGPAGLRPDLPFACKIKNSDCERRREFRQVTTAVGDGTVAALAASNI